MMPFPPRNNCGTCTRAAPCAAAKGRQTGTCVTGWHPRAKLRAGSAGRARAPPAEVPLPTQPAEPYRSLFPFGAAYALVGAALWPLYALGWIGYPGPAHAAIMMEGFELGFVAGFALTVLPRFTRTPPVGLGLVRAQQGLALVFGAGWALGRPALAHAAFLASLLLVAWVALDRLRRRQNDPPEEALFLFGGVAFGLVGAALLLAQSLGAWAEPAPRLASRLLSVGMVLSMVVGMGGLLVPVFLGIKDPLVIPHV